MFEVPGDVFTPETIAGKITADRTYLDHFDVISARCRSWNSSDQGFRAPISSLSRKEEMNIKMNATEAHSNSQSMGFPGP